ncbi:hypothetical protein D3C72_2403360 [compost metagenome]
MPSCAGRSQFGIVECWKAAKVSRVNAQIPMRAAPSGMPVRPFDSGSGTCERAEAMASKAPVTRP